MEVELTMVAFKYEQESIQVCDVLSMKFGDGQSEHKVESPIIVVEKASGRSQDEIHSLSGFALISYISDSHEDVQEPPSRNGVLASLQDVA